MIVSITFLYLSLRKVEINILVSLLNVSFIPVLFYILILCLIAAYLRAVRWKILLKEYKIVSINDTYNYNNISYLFNNIFPVRAGDIIKVLMISNKHKISKIKLFTSVGLERLFDMTGLAFIFLFSLTINGLPDWFYRGSIIIISGFLILLIFLYLLSLKKGKSDFKSGRTNLFTKFLEKLTDKFDKLVSYLKILQNPAISFYLIGISVIIWIIYVSTGIIILNTLLPDVNPVNISVVSILFVSFSMLLPAAPGNIGTYQYACILAFGLFDIPESNAFAFSIFSQIPAYIINNIIGMISLYQEGLSFKKLKKIKDNENYGNEFV